MVAGVGCLVVLVPCLALGLGLLRRRSWARALTLAVSAFWVAASALGLLVAITSRGEWSGHALGMLGFCLGIVYFGSQGFVLLRAREEFTRS